MEEISSCYYNNTNNANNDVSDIKMYPTSLSTKGNTNSVCDIHTINRKNGPITMNNNLTFKITEKECSDINLIVRNSVEKINDLLNSTEFNNNNFTRTLKRSSKNVIAEILEKERIKEKEKIVKTKTMKDSGVKANVTFNINNFINVPNEQSKNGSVSKKVERYNDDDEFGMTNQLTFSEKNKNNCKAKSNQKGVNFNNRTKNNNYMNYGSSKHNNGKIFRNCVRKKKLFDDGMNDNFNNNINIVNYKNNQKKIQKSVSKEDKNKSITVNTKYKKNKNVNDNRNYISDNFMINKDKNVNLIHNTLNDSNQTKSKNTNLLKYSISEDMSNNKIPVIEKGNIINLNNFAPNIININSLSDHRNIKNFLLNNDGNVDNNNKNKNNSMSKYAANNSKNKSKEKQSNKTLFSPKNDKKYNNFRENKEKYYNNIYFINNNNDEKYEGFKKYKNSFLPVNNPINNKKNNNDNKGLFSATFSLQNKENIIPFNNININNNDSSSNLDDTQKRASIKQNLKKEKSGNLKKSGYSCEHTNFKNNNNIRNVHQILNKIYSKKFPNKIKTNSIMKLMLFLNEYLINNNLLDDYHNENNRKKLDVYSKFLCEQINIDFPQEDDVNIDKMVNSAKKIQRMWRKKKIEKSIGKKGEENELKKMVINKYIRNAGFKVKKIIGLFNTLVEDFNNIGNEHEMEEMFYNIQQIIKRKLTPYEKNNLYKKYINSIIYLK